LLDGVFGLLIYRSPFRSGRRGRLCLWFVSWPVTSSIRRPPHLVDCGFEAHDLRIHALISRPYGGFIKHRPVHGCASPSSSGV
jgi:hypothetical protein